MSDTKIDVASLKEDATNRAWRVFLQGLGIDLLVAVSMLVYAVSTDPNPIVWAAMGASLLRTVAQTAASYVMRRFLDGSKFPTPLPPAPVPPPAEPADEPFGGAGAVPPHADGV